MESEAQDQDLAPREHEAARRKGGVIGRGGQRLGRGGRRSERGDRRSGRSRNLLGALAGAVAGGVALAFGELVEAFSQDIPGLVLGMGEWILDITPGFIAAESIESLGSLGKAALLPGIAVVALLVAAVLGRAGAKGHLGLAVGGFVGFGLLGGFTTARNPMSPYWTSWLWALVAAGLGLATLLFLLNRLKKSSAPAPTSPSEGKPEMGGLEETADFNLAAEGEATIVSDVQGEGTNGEGGGSEPSEGEGGDKQPGEGETSEGEQAEVQPDEGVPEKGGLAMAGDHRGSRREFLGWTAGAGALAVGGLVASRGITPESAAETARSNITFGNLTTTTAGQTTTTAGQSAVSSTSTTTTTTTQAAPTTSVAPTANITTRPFTNIEGLASYITPNDSFYRIDTALRPPQVNPNDWSLEIKGMVDRPYTLTWDEILAMPMEEHDITLSCVSNPIGGQLVGNARWLGVPLATLLERAEVQSGADQFVGKSVDDWTAGFPTERIFDGRNALLAIGMNGEPLPIRHGFPARLIVAGIYGYVSAVKWVSEIELTRWDDFNGYWVPRGWSKLGPMKTTSRIDVPANEARVPAGEITVAGVAWSPPRGISAVEISIDDDEWQGCDLAVPGNAENWVQWRTTWDAEPGRHKIIVRAVDGEGQLQPLGPKTPAPDGAEGWHQVGVNIFSI